MTPPPARDLATRVADTQALLAAGTDAWVATAGDDGPWMVPLSYLWHSGRLLFGTDEGSRTVRNLRARPVVRVGLGGTRDVVMVDGDVELVVPAALPPQVQAAYAAAMGGSDLPAWATAAFWVAPRRIQAWREENELPGRTVLRDGTWLA